MSGAGQPVECLHALHELSGGAALSTQEEQGQQRRPAHIAAAFGHAALLTTMAQLGADLRSADKKGWTPLHWAADSGHVEAVTLLARLVGGEMDDFGTAALNKLDQTGLAPVHLAARGDHAGAHAATFDVHTAACGFVWSTMHY